MSANERGLVAKFSVIFYSYRRLGVLTRAVGFDAELHNTVMRTLQKGVRFECLSSAKAKESFEKTHANDYFMNPLFIVIVYVLLHVYVCMCM